LQKKETKYYGLNHYYKETRDQSFPDQQMCWQLVPSVFRMGQQINAKNKEEEKNNTIYDYRRHGYWRIAQLMQSRKQCSNNADEAFYWNDDKNNLRSGGGAQLLQVLFAPVYKDMRANDLPVIYTLFQKDDTPNTFREINDRRQTMTNSICKQIKFHFKFKQEKCKKEFEQELIKMHNAIEEETSENQKHHLVEKLGEFKDTFVRTKLDQEKYYKEECDNFLSGVDIFALYEHECFFLEIFCDKKYPIYLNFALPTKTEKLEFKGLNYSGLSVDLILRGKPLNFNHGIFVHFIRPDNLFLQDGMNVNSKFITNTINKNIYTRYNDQILMGFLIEHMTKKQKKNNKFFSCELQYKVVRENIILDVTTEGKTYFRYDIEINIELMGNEASFVLKQEILIFITRNNMENGEYFFSEENGDELTEQFKNYVNNEENQKLRESRCEKQIIIIDVNLEKFVYDYERHCEFFKSECKCEYEDIYKTALAKRSDDECHKINILEYEKSNDGTYRQITKQSGWASDIHAMEETLTNGVQGDLTSKRAFVPPSDSVKEGEVPESWEQHSATGMLSTEAAKPLPALEVAVVAVQAPSKRSKVSLARQQAANATMEES